VSDLSGISRLAVGSPSRKEQRRARAALFYKRTTKMNKMNNTIDKSKSLPRSKRGIKEEVRSS
jgi:hypothetical protein